MPCSSVAVVPETATRSPNLTAREYPTIGSQVVPLEIRASWPIADVLHAPAARPGGTRAQLSREGKLSSSSRATERIGGPTWRDSGNSQRTIADIREINCGG